MIKLTSLKGTSSWLTAHPLKEFGYILNRQEFIDANFAMNYDLKIKDGAKVCACGEKNSVFHSPTCKNGGYVALRLIGRGTLFQNFSAVLNVKIVPQMVPTIGKSLSRFQWQHNSRPS